MKNKILIYAVMIFSVNYTMAQYTQVGNLRHITEEKTSYPEQELTWIRPESEPMRNPSM